MSERDSTTAPPPVKPDRPEGSPFYWHKSGRWAKKIRGQLRYFGRGSHDEALEAYNRVKTDLHEGRKPREETTGALTVVSLCAKFITAKEDQHLNGELSQLTLREYAAACKRLMRVFGKNRLVEDLRPDDFAKLRKDMSKSWGLVRLKSEIIRTRTVFIWAHKMTFLPTLPVYGDAFKVPSVPSIRKHKSTQTSKLFGPDELASMLADAGQPLRSMILLGVNCGFGNSDVASLPIYALDLAGEWILFPRPKTGVDRRVPLWPETVQSLREWLATRPKPTDPDDTELVFITKQRQSWKDDTGRALSHEMRKLLDGLNLDAEAKRRNKAGRGFYALRHTFQTIGDECGDFIAVRKIMGHVFSKDISDVYRERVSDERLKRVTDHIRAWLFGKKAGGGEKPSVLKFRQEGKTA